MLILGHHHEGDLGSLPITSSEEVPTRPFFFLAVCELIIMRATADMIKTTLRKGVTEWMWEFASLISNFFCHSFAQGNDERTVR